MKKIVERMDALTTVADVEIVVGVGAVDSEWHFDGFTVCCDGIWMHRKDLGKWFYKGYADKEWWMVLDEDEVSFEGRG